MKASNAVYRMNQYGNMTFPINRRLTAQRYKPLGFTERPVFAYLLMVLFGAVDFVAFKQLFGSFLYDSVAMQSMMIVAFLAGFDIAPIILGNQVRRKIQGLKPIWLVVIVSSIAIVVSVVMNYWLRIAVKDLVLPDLSANTASLMGEVKTEQATNPLAFTFANVAGMIPFITSLAGFGVSLCASNPLRDEMRRISEVRDALEDEIAQIESILEEYDRDAEYYERQMKDDDDRFKSADNARRETAFMYCDYVREKIKEHLGDPAATNELSKETYDDLSERLPSTDRADDTHERPTSVKTKETALSMKAS